VLSASEPLFRALKLLGAAYLVLLGLQSLRAALSGRGQRHERRGSPPSLDPTRAMRQGVLSNLGNPKMAVFFASLLPQFAPDGPASFLALLALGLLFCSLTFGWLILYAVAIARAGRFLHGRARRAIDALTGVVLVAFGARLASESR
jgi:threonine/homoserine/homoserine lactone efflux protein